MRATCLLVLMGAMAALPAGASAGWRDGVGCPPPQVQMAPRGHVAPGPQPYFPPIVPRYSFGTGPGPTFTGVPPVPPQSTGVPGFWDQQGNAWYWVDGAWLAAPGPGYVWVPPHWAPVANSSYWVPGHWAAPGEE